MICGIKFDLILVVASQTGFGHDGGKSSVQWDTR